MKCANMIKHQSDFYIFANSSKRCAPALAQWPSSQSAPLAVPTPTTAALHKLRNRPAEPIARPTSEMGPTRRPFRPSQLSWQIPRSSLSLYFDPAGCKRNDKTFGRGPALGSNTDQIDVLNCSGTDQTSDRWRMTRGSSRRRRGEVIDGALW